MAAPSMSPAPAPTARFIRAYLLTWGVLATGGLGYLASLAWQPELLQHMRPAETAEVDQGLQLANRALTEVGLVRRALSDVARDLGQVRETIAERDVEDKRVRSRIAALEERMASAPLAATAPEPPAAEKAPEKVPEKAKVDKSRNSAARLAQRHSLPPRETYSAAIETGSIEAKSNDGQSSDSQSNDAQSNDARSGDARSGDARSGDARSGDARSSDARSSGAQSSAISFGEPVVTPSKAATYGVQLAAGPSLDALRQSWSVLLERHTTALGPLQPHVVAPRADGTGSYRLVAGPLPSKADADKLCAKLGVGRQGCFATPFVGQPL
jgi:hypothetical protein